MSLEDAVRCTCARIAELLISKNKQYGNSAYSPIGVFATTDHQLSLIATRADDKLGRIRNMGGLVSAMDGSAPAGEDAVLDLVGYLVLALAIHQLHSRGGGVG